MFTCTNVKFDHCVGAHLSYGEPLLKNDLLNNYILWDFDVYEKYVNFWKVQAVNIPGF